MVAYRCAGWTRDVEAEIEPALDELGIALVPFSPLGKGFLTGTVDTATDFTPGDIRATIPSAADLAELDEAATRIEAAGARYNEIMQGMTGR